MWLFLAALVPVSNLVPLFFQVNDRYLLLPTLGLAFVAWGAIRWAETRRAGRAAMAACVVLAVGCGAVSFRDSFSWRSDEALWERATRVRPRSYYAWMKLGETRRDAGEFEAAHAAYTRAVELEPELLPARGGRVLNCLVSEKVGHAVEVEQLERFAPLVSSYLAAAGSSRRTLSVALKMYTRGAPRCALMVMAEGVQYEPAVPDRAILDLARDFGEGRPGGCRLIEHVSEGGRRTPAYRELAEECERMEAGQ
jgi:tetratricopeptide (TPR) repeat protein